MSLPIYVDAYSGYKANERPRQFQVDEELFEIVEVEDRWYEPEAEYFRVRTPEGKRYILRYDQQQHQWTLQSGFNGAELMARPGVELVPVEPQAIRRAEALIAGCEQCRADQSDHPFNCVLADVLAKHGAFEFIMAETARCPNCRAEVTEKTLVEPQGGIDVGAITSVNR